MRARGGFLPPWWLRGREGRRCPQPQQFSASQPLSASLGGLRPGRPLYLPALSLGLGVHVCCAPRAGRCPPLHTHPRHCHLLVVYCVPCPWHLPLIRATSCRVLQFAHFTKEMGKSVEMGAGLQQQMGGGGRGEGGGWSPGVASGPWVADCLVSQLLPLPGPQPPFRHPGPDRSQSPFLAPAFCGWMGAGAGGVSFAFLLQECTGHSSWGSL